jgi:hypothetical protein
VPLARHERCQRGTHPSQVRECAGLESPFPLLQWDWYRGKIVAVNEDGTYGVTYDNEDPSELDVALDRLHHAGPGSNGAHASGTATSSPTSSSSSASSAAASDPECDEGRARKTAKKPAPAKTKKAAKRTAGKRAAPFEEGDSIEGAWQNPDGSSAVVWYAGTIVAANGDGTFRVQYADGDSEAGVPLARLRRVGPPSKKGNEGKTSKKANAVKENYSTWRLDKFTEMAPFPFTGKPQGLKNPPDFAGPDGTEPSYERIMGWLLPRPEGVPYYEWFAARMREYYAVVTTQPTTVRGSGKGGPTRERVWKPSWLTCAEEITADVVRRYHGQYIVRSATGLHSIRQCYTSNNRSLYNVTVADALPRNLLSDLSRLVHFVMDPELDASEESEDDDEKSGDCASGDDGADAATSGSVAEAGHGAPATYVRVEPPAHLHKLGCLEDAYNERSFECIEPGWCLCGDESMMQMFYHSCMTIGPLPKPTRTGAETHRLCCGSGPFCGVNLYSRIYGGKTDTGLVRRAKEKQIGKTTAIWDQTVAPYGGEGRDLLLDSAHLNEKGADFLATKHTLNVTGSASASRFGFKHIPEMQRKAKATIDRLPLRSGKSTFVQRNQAGHERPMAAGIWADNARFIVVSTSIGPTVVVNGATRKSGAGKTYRDCPEMHLHYAALYRWVDFHNKLTSWRIPKSELHNATPKLALYMFNSRATDAHIVYGALGGKGSIVETRLAYGEFLCAAGPAPHRPGAPAARPTAWALAMQPRNNAAPPLDCEGFAAPVPIRTTRVTDPGAPTTPGRDYFASPRKQASTDQARARKAGRGQSRGEVRVHSSTWVAQRSEGQCAYKGCPGTNRSKEGARGGHYICPECTTAAAGRAVYYCNYKERYCHGSHLEDICKANGTSMPLHRSVYTSKNLQCNYRYCPGEGSSMKEASGKEGAKSGVRPARTHYKCSTCQVHMCNNNGRNCHDNFRHEAWAREAVPFPALGGRK